MKIFLDYTLTMPVTKTAKRALKGSMKKKLINALIMAKLEAAIRFAQKGKSKEKILEAISLTDRAAKKKVIHKNKAARIKSRLSKLMPKGEKKIKKSRKSSSK
jgi:small subunit ribosomal protein S20